MKDNIIIIPFSDNSGAIIDKRYLSGPTDRFPCTDVQKGEEDPAFSPYVQIGNSWYIFEEMERERKFMQDRRQNMWNNYRPFNFK